MAEWLYDREGLACLVLDDNRLCNAHGLLVGWINAGSVYLQHGQHAGWLQGGVVYDGTNAALAFSRDRMGYLPNLPKLGRTPALPALMGATAAPEFAAPPPRPGRGDWSRHAPDRYFRMRG